MEKIFLILVFCLLSGTAYAVTKLKWDASVGAEKYYLYSDKQVEPIASTDAPITEILLNTLNLTSGETYIFTVKAWNSAGFSDASNPVGYPIFIKAKAVYSTKGFGIISR